MASRNSYEVRFFAENDSMSEIFRYGVVRILKIGVAVFTGSVMYLTMEMLKGGIFLTEITGLSSFDSPGFLYIDFRSLISSILWSERREWPCTLEYAK